MFFEIEGHTDSTGPDDLQREAGRGPRGWRCATTCTTSTASRSAAWRSSPTARRKPVVDNKTRANRAQNRRVVIKVLE